MEKRLETLIQDISVIADIRNIARNNSVQFSLEHPDSPVQSVKYMLIASQLEPMNSIGLRLPINCIWFCYDSDSPRYMKGYKRTSRVPSGGLSSTWIELISYMDIFEPPQYYEAEDGNGSQGPKGDKGDKGDIGPMGPAGAQGTSGPANNVLDIEMGSDSLYELSISQIEGYTTFRFHGSTDIPNSPPIDVIVPLVMCRFIIENLTDRGIRIKSSSDEGYQHLDIDSSSFYTCDSHTLYASLYPIVKPAEVIDLPSYIEINISLLTNNKFYPDLLVHIPRTIRFVGFPPDPMNPNVSIMLGDRPFDCSFEWKIITDSGGPGRAIVIGQGEPISIVKGISRRILFDGSRFTSPVDRPGFAQVSITGKEMTDLDQEGFPNGANVVRLVGETEDFPVVFFPPTNGFFIIENSTNRKNNSGQKRAIQVEVTGGNSNCWLNMEGSRDMYTIADGPVIYPSFAPPTPDA